MSFDEIIRSSTEQLRGTVDVAPPARQGTSSTEQLRGSVDVAPPARQGTDVNGTGSFETEIIVNSSSNVSNGKGSNASNDDNAMDLARQSADLARQSTTSLAPIQLAPIGLLRDHLVLAMGDVGRFNPQNGTYRLNRAFWECYSKKWGASVLFIDPRRFEKCQLHTDWFFRRVCAVASLVEAFVRDSKENVSETADSFGLPVAPRWIFHLDGDSMLSNLDLPLSDFTVPWDREGKSLVFYERFHNGEIAAGNYALRVSELAAQFLRGWERKVSETKNVKFTNSDNGVLHLHLAPQMGYTENPYFLILFCRGFTCSWRRVPGLVPAEGAELPSGLSAECLPRLGERVAAVPSLQGHRVLRPLRGLGEVGPGAQEGLQASARRTARPRLLCGRLDQDVFVQAPCVSPRGEKCGAAGEDDRPELHRQILAVPPGSGSLCTPDRERGPCEAAELQAGSLRAGQCERHF